MSIIVLKFGQVADAGIVATLRVVSLCNGLLRILLTSAAIAVSPRG